MAEDVKVILGVDPSTESNVQGWFSGKEFKVKLTPEGEFAKQLEAALQLAQERASQKSAGTVAKNLMTAQEKANKAWADQEKSQIIALAKEQEKAAQQAATAKQKASESWAAQERKQIQQLAKEQEAQAKATAKAQEKALVDAQKRAIQEANSKTLSNNMESWLKNNAKYAQEYGASISELQQKLAQNPGDASVYKQVAADFKAIQAEAKATIGSVTDLGSALKNAFGSTTLGMITKAFGAFALRELRQAAREMVSSAVEIESSLAQLQVITGASGSQLETFFSEGATAAKEYGTEVADMLDSVTTFSRLGYNLQESLDFSRVATELSNVADVAVDAGTSGLTSILKAYQDEEVTADHIADVLTVVGQKYAISASELMTAFERGGAALSATGTSFEKSAALFAAANAALQNPEAVG